MKSAKYKFRVCDFLLARYRGRRQRGSQIGQAITSESGRLKISAQFFSLPLSASSMSGTKARPPPAASFENDRKPFASGPVAPRPSTTPFLCPFAPILICSLNPASRSRFNHFLGNRRGRGLSREAIKRIDTSDSYRQVICTGCYARNNLLKVSRES